MRAQINLVKMILDQEQPFGAQWMPTPMEKAMALLLIEIAETLERDLPNPLDAPER